jgi:pyrroloquinoline quinone (PQQ) biosynthesis protein C
MRDRSSGARRLYNPLTSGDLMTTEAWYDALTVELLAQSPFRRSEYFKRFASGALSREEVWGHIAQHYLLIAAFPRIFSGIHTRCDDFDVRKDCARHLLVEDLGFFEGNVGGTPDHDELFRRIGDDLGYPRSVYDTIAAVPEMAAILEFFRRLAHEIPWSASLCATALLEEEVVEIAQTVGRALVQHYGVRPEWGGMNYTVHEAIEKEESGETKSKILKHLRAPEDRRAAEAAMREMHALLERYADGLARRYLS